MTPARQTIPAMAAGDVAFADDEIALGKAFHQIADLLDHADKLVPNGHGNGDGLLGPGVPVIYMYVCPADRGLQDAQQNIFPTGLRNGHVLEPKPGLGLRLHDGLHGFRHDAKVNESGEQESRKLYPLIACPDIIAAQERNALMNDTSKPSGKRITGWFIEAILPAIFLANAIIFAGNAQHKLVAHTGEAVFDFILSFVSGYVAVVWVIARPLKRYFEKPNR
jgi:hypothetical protein